MTDLVYALQVVERVKTLEEYLKQIRRALEKSQVWVET